MASRILLALVAGLVVNAVLLAQDATAQGVASVDPYSNVKIEQVRIRITNPSPDAEINKRVEDQIRALLGLFPGERFSEQRLAAQLSQASRVRDVGATDYEVGFGARGGVNLNVSVTLGAAAAAAEKKRTFPVIYDRNGTYVRFKLDLLGLYYANNNAWYGRPDLMLAGNPLVEGTPAGEGYDQWLDGYVHYGVYGITPLASDLYFYGGLSAITSASLGQELFTDKTRAHTAIEDAYVGLVGGRTDADGNRFS